jgi:hypothetical protein
MRAIYDRCSNRGSTLAALEFEPLPPGHARSHPIGRVCFTLRLDSVRGAVYG